VAGFFKVWVEPGIGSSKWFHKLHLIERGFFYELLRLCKQHGDSGEIFLRNIPALSSEMHADRKTARKCLRLFQETGDVSYVEDDDGGLSITVHNYKYWQELTMAEAMRTLGAKRGKIAEKSKQICIPDQTRPDQTRPRENAKPSARGSEAVLFWTSEYKTVIGRDYRFQKKDGVAIAALVASVGIDQYKKAAAWLIRTSERWYSDNKNPCFLNSKINDILNMIDKEGGAGDTVRSGGLFSDDPITGGGVGTQG